MAIGRVKAWWLGLIQHRLNPWTLDLARRGRGPFSLIRHVGRKTGRIYEAPVILGESSDGLVAELTYGPEVNWYRNIRAGGGHALHRGRWFRIVSVEPYPVDAGRRSFGAAAGMLLRLLRRREFRLLRVEPDSEPSARESETPDGPEDAADLRG